MKRLPGALYVVDPRKEHIAVTEANRLKIPVVAITDSNCDPDLITYVIPGNDDAIRAVKLLTGKIADACQEGRQEAAARGAEDPSSEMPWKGQLIAGSEQSLRTFVKAGGSVA